jgi:CheY-like chemotaxis protein
VDISVPELPSRKGDAPGPPFRVLVVDDNRDIADSTAQLLTIVGFDARACYDGQAALAVADAFRPGVCFLDLNMPGMGGEELAVRLRAGAGGRPLVLVAVTAMSSPEYRERTAAAGFDLHLVKPVDPYQLVEVVDTLFRAGSPAGASTGARR